jgi:hypothetical protein
MVCVNTNHGKELDLEVLPENSASFSAKTKAVISEQSVEKYQPARKFE